MTAVKQWVIQGVTDDFYIFAPFQKEKGVFTLPQSVLDQLRRDAVEDYFKSPARTLDVEAYKELLDIVNMVANLFPKEIDEVISRMENLNKERAKTLGENVK